MAHPPVKVVASGGVPRTQVSDNAPVRTVVGDDDNSPIITLTTNAPPVVLLDANGDQYVPE